MKKTPLHAIHESLGAKMAAFAGYEMPISYQGITEEHLCVREKVGIFDVSHMGEFIIRGDHAFDLIQKVSCNDIARLSPGKALYTCLMNREGGIVDDMLVYQLSEQAFMLVVNGANIEKDWDWIQQFKPASDIEVIDISDRSALLAVQGPKAAHCLQSLTDMDLHNMKYYTFERGIFAGIENVIVSATGYTGSGGFEVYFDNKHAVAIWQAIMEAGAAYGIQAIGLGARDTLRLEKGYCLYGNDINDTTSPLEAGLGWLTRLNSDFIGKEVLVRQKEEGLTRKLVGFELLDRGIARHGYPILDMNGDIIGEVTSGTKGPSVQKAIGMGYVAIDFVKPETMIQIQVRKKMIAAKVVKMPFI